MLSKNNNKNYKLLSHILFHLCLVLITASLLSLLVKGSIFRAIGVLLIFSFITLIIYRPVIGLHLLPAVHYFFPHEIDFTGSSFFSLGLTISLLTIFSGIIQIVFLNMRLRLHSMYLVILSLGLMIVIKVVDSGDNLNFFYLLTFIQGCITFFLFFIVVKNVSTGLNVLRSWVICYGLFCISHIVRGPLQNTNPDIIVSILSIRYQALGAFNPNVLSWIAVLLLPLAIGFFKVEKNKLIKLLLGISFLGMILILVFSASRAGFIGLILTLILIIMFGSDKAKITNQQSIFMIALILFTSFLWKNLISSGYFGADRSIGDETFNTEAIGRTTMIFDGLILGLSKPFFGHGYTHADGTYITTHSAIAKAFSTYGIFYTILLFYPLYMVITKSFYLMKNHSDDKIRIINRMIFISFLVAIPEAIFGITLFSAGYAHIYWLITAFIIIVINERNSLEKNDLFIP